VLGIVAGVSVAAWLGTQAPQQRHVLLRSWQIAAGEAPKGERFRMGGMVEKGSVVKQPARWHPFSADFNTRCR
jgi:cytochrome c-type biogenesis protein CcmE